MLGATKPGMETRRNELPREDGWYSLAALPMSKMFRGIAQAKELATMRLRHVRPPAAWLRAGALAALAVFSLAQTTPAKLATMTGRVILAAAAKPVATTHGAAAADASHYQHGATTASTGIPEESVVVAVVYAEPRDEATKLAVEAARPYTPGDAPPAVVEQKDMRFIPAVLAIRVGMAVSFPNEDDFYHNVFSYSPAHPFDLGRYRKDEKSAPVVFDKKGVIKVFCEIHEFMRTTILVVDTPYYTTTDAQGSYRLENLLPGAYTLTAWVNDKTVWSQPLDVKEGQALTVDLGPTPTVRSTP